MIEVNKSNYKNTNLLLVKIVRKTQDDAVVNTNKMIMTVFWDFPPCSMVEIDRRFGDDYCLLHQGDE
jgi:hypothetical protein